MFFKKQAFKIKDLLKEKGVEIPLVTIQEILAKSYGFNNRHVALNNDMFNQQLDSLKKPEPQKEFVPSKDSSIYDLPQFLTRENINNYSFWWNEVGDDFCIHNLDTDPGDPYCDDHFDVDVDLTIYEHRGDMMVPTFLHYRYNKEKDCLELYTNILNFVKYKGLKPTYKNFKSMDLSKEEILSLERGIDLWDDTKKILAHKDCPIEICLKHAKSKDYFVRICAIFSKPHRDTLYKLAQNDLDVRVRKCYYGYMIDSGASINDLRKEIKSDVKIYNVLKNTLVLTSPGRYEPLINW